MKTKNDRTGKKKRKKKTKERRKKYETTVQATSQQTPGSSNARQLWVFFATFEVKSWIIHHIGRWSTYHHEDSQKRRDKHA